MKTKSLLKDLNSAIGDIKYIAFKSIQFKGSYVCIHNVPSMHPFKICLHNYMTVCS